MTATFALALPALAACVERGPVEVAQGVAPAYGRTDVISLADDLVGILAEVEGIGATREAAVDYARCVAAGHVLGKGLSFTRHVRTSVTEAAGVFTADALYSVTSAVPPGLARIDAEVTVADCAERGVPTV
jgi:hypothetical protein